MNIIKEGLRNPKMFLNFLDDVINGREIIGRYFALKIISKVMGNKGFESGKIVSLLPLIKVIE